jgi:hypothetical protein
LCECTYSLEIRKIREVSEGAESGVAERENLHIKELLEVLLVLFGQTAVQLLVVQDERSELYSIIDINASV